MKAKTVRVVTNILLTIMYILCAVFVIEVICTFLTSCAPVQEIYDPPQYQTGGIYTENDSIIGSDTMFYWNKD